LFWFMNITAVQTAAIELGDGLAISTKAASSNVADTSVVSSAKPRKIVEQQHGGQHTPDRI
jgi:hypothetical protein